MRNQDSSDDDEIYRTGIAGDVEERHRIQLERNLRDISLPFSVSNPSQSSDNELQEPDFGFGQQQSVDETDSSIEVEYPRHGSRPHDISVFHGQDSSLHDHSHMHNDYQGNYYSYRTGDEEEGLNPFAFDTMSTAAHHASAITLSAGLPARSGKPGFGGNVSMSGAEYDPDRPLDVIMDGIVGDMSVLDVNATPPARTRKTGQVAHSVSFDPRTMGSNHLRYSHSSQSDSEPHTPDYDHPSFRGRRTSANKHSGRTSQSRAFPNTSFSQNFDHPTPKAKHRIQPQLNVEPPTPSTMATGNKSTGSKFAKLARNLAKDIEASHHGIAEMRNDDITHSTRRDTKKSRVSRQPFQDVVNNPPHINVEQIPPPVTKNSGRRSGHINGPSIAQMSQRRDDPINSGIVQLPDVTGLTSAVGSPPRKNVDWQAYHGSSDNDVVEGQLLQTLTTLQTRLNQLESHNSESRRRVRELELELQTCKMDLKRERTRVLEREEIIVEQQKEYQKRRDLKKPSRQSFPAVDDMRYKEVREEKKALEELIATLRSHLSRLTAELTSQRALLEEIRSSRDSDRETLKLKMAEVDTLKAEVERLGGEVEILRGVVEDGLRERRRAKETSMSVDRDGSMSRSGATQETATSSFHREESRDSQPEIISLPHPAPQRLREDQRYDKTLRTDHATVGSSRADGTGTSRYIADDEVEQIMIDVEERRSDRSASSSQDRSLPHIDNSSCIASNTRHGIAEQQMPRQGTANRLEAHNDDITVDEADEALRARRPMCPPPKRAKPSTRSPTSKHDTPATPFPQIRGEHAERLFFSAPEHNAKTCRVCHRRTRPSQSEDGIDAPSWLPPRKRARVRMDEQASNVHFDTQDILSNGNNPFSHDRLPPQTVLVKVLRELEDDFTHYKGIYSELADQYKLMDPVSNVPKRNVLAEHLQDVINTLEQKGDQIASLFSLLEFKDKPVAEPVAPPRFSPPRSPRRSSRLRPLFSGQRTLKKHATYA